MGFHFGQPFSKPIIVALGNPGSEYKRTRHNVGYMLGERLSKNYKKNARGRYLYSVSKEYTVIKPITYMNNSGIAVEKALARAKALPADILVICDDFNLPFGKIRFRASGSAGGHNGIKSIINTLATNEFPRLRLGIGDVEKGNAKDFVLDEFNPAEWPVLNDMLATAKKCVFAYINEGSEAAMNKFN